MTSKQEFIAGLPLFADLSEAAQAAVARVAREYAFEPNAVIAYQRDVAGSFYIVKEGRLFARAIDPNGIARDTRSYTPGQYFNDLWLFLPGIHSATVKGAEPGRLLIINSADFLGLLEEYPVIIDDLAPRDDGDIHYGLSEAAWREAQKLKLRRRVRASSAAALLPEERVEFFARRSRWLLAGRLVMPILLILLAIVVAIIMPIDTGLQRALKIGAPVVLMLVGGVWVALRIIDWRGDYFIITNRHLTHHEFELRRFRVRLVKIPIGQVQTVEILKPSLLANAFNVGSARVTTAAVAGNVLFDYIDNPLKVKDVLERLTGLYRSVESAQTQAVMRQSLEKHFGMDAPIKPQDETAPPPRVRRPESLLTRLRLRYGWRVVEGNTITYRKSIFVLIKRIAVPLVVLIGLAVFVGLALYLDVTPWVIALVVTIVGFGDALGLIWQVEDWRNDIFQLTDRFIIDIDRVPFGFGESRKQAAISNVQNVDATRPGFFPTLFNYGFVSVDTAGAKGDIVFDYVPNPELIQSDIFQRLDDFRRQQRINEGSARRQEYAMLIDVYRQAMEQQRIPPRTPLGYSEEENQQTP
ncbi:MAG: cyclic nucleotide-binding domain-containing protein [Candidatus Promineofilum sp.]|nr:cyclic nucleotide-binding domain-containing protein [Promineifilum sp.]